MNVKFSESQNCLNLFRFNSVYKTKFFVLFFLNYNVSPILNGEHNLQLLLSLSSVGVFCLSSFLVSLFLTFSLRRFKFSCLNLYFWWSQFNILAINLVVNYGLRVKLNTDSGLTIEKSKKKSWKEWNGCFWIILHCWRAPFLDEEGGKVVVWWSKRVLSHHAWWKKCTINFI